MLLICLRGTETHMNGRIFVYLHLLPFLCFFFLSPLSVTFIIVGSSVTLPAFPCSVFTLLPYSSLHFTCSCLLSLFFLLLFICLYSPFPSPCFSTLLFTLPALFPYFFLHFTCSHPLSFFLLYFFISFVLTLPPFLPALLPSASSFTSSMSLPLTHLPSSSCRLQSTRSPSRTATR